MAGFKISTPAFFAVSAIILLLPSLFIYVRLNTTKITPFDEKLKAYGIFVNSSASSVKEDYRPKILIWAKQYHPIGWTFPDLSDDEGRCDVTWDREEYTTSDAVVFYMKSCDASDLPDRGTRSTNQVFVWWAHESPWTVLHYYHHELKEFNNYFNWSMTYRRDSDVLASFAPTPAMDYVLYKFGRRKEMRDENLFKRSPMSVREFRRQKKLLMSRKSKLIAWIASDCNHTRGASKRLELVEQLLKKGGLQIDKFGKCAQMEIPRNYTTLFQTLSPYKFYLAFENSYHCLDYVTEKSLYNSLVSGAVPIVHGPTKEDAKKILPSGSFIYLEDFANFSSIASYLTHLDKNITAYLEYFRWWREPGADIFPRYGFNYGSNGKKSDLPWNYAIQDDMMEIERFGLYNLCRKLKNMDHVKTSKTIPDLNKLWYGVERKECTDL